MICCDKLDKKEIQERERLGIAAIVSAYICKWGTISKDKQKFIAEFSDNDIINICRAINQILYPDFQIKDKYHARYTKEINGPNGDNLDIIESFLYYLNTATEEHRLEYQTKFLCTNFEDEEDPDDRDCPQGYITEVDLNNKAIKGLNIREKLGFNLHVFGDEVCQDNIKKYLDDVSDGEGAYYQTCAVYFNTEELYHTLCNICMPAFASHIFDIAYDMFSNEEFDFYIDFCDTGICNIVRNAFDFEECITYSLPYGLFVFNEEYLNGDGKHFDYLHNTYFEAIMEMMEMEFEKYQEELH